MIIDNLRLIVSQNKGRNSLYIRNLLKEQLQYYVLNFIYNSLYGERFIFKGGTCLRFCFNLPRLSEDLDFDVKNYQEFNQEELVLSLVKYFQEKLLVKEINYKISGKNKIIYLKFPLHQFFEEGEYFSQVLYVRIDTAPLETSFFKEEISLKSTADFSFIIKRYSLSDIFAGKIAAILTREKWEGKEKQPRFKGRDYFDIFWLKEKRVSPNFAYLFDVLKIGDRKKVVDLLEKKLNEASKRLVELKSDLLPFIEEQNFIDSFIKNFALLKKDLINYLR